MEKQYTEENSRPQTRRNLCVEKLADVLDYLVGDWSPSERLSCAENWLKVLQEWSAAVPIPSPTVVSIPSYRGEVEETGSIYGLCPHHMLPFLGTYTIVFSPRQKTLGLSSAGRIVNALSRSPQLQEQMTEKIGRHFQDILEPSRIAVKIQARHLCKEMRGHTGPLTTTWRYPQE